MEWTNSYGHSKGYLTENFNFTLSDILRGVALNLLFGVVVMPARYDYWSTDEKLHLPFVSGVMSRAKFEMIQKCLKLCDHDAEEPNDPIAKFRNMHELFNTAAVRLFGHFGSIAFDEMSPGYSGRSIHVKRTKHKKVPSALQSWATADSRTGYVINIEWIFDKIAHQDDDPTLSRTENSVYRSVTTAVKNGGGRYGHIFTDNLFSSPTLFEKIWQNLKYYCTGTWRGNRGIPPELKNKKLSTAEAKKLKDEREANNSVSPVKIAVSNFSSSRNTSSFATTPQASSSQAATQSATELIRPERLKGMWGSLILDTNYVNFLSTFSWPYEYFVGGIKKKLKYDIQHAYNNKMNGVDKMDQMLQSYSTYKGSRRWWRRIYHHLLDLAVCNGAIIWKNVPSGSQVHKPHRSFILSLVDGLLVEADGMDLVCDREERQQANEQEKEGKRKRNRSQPRHVKRLRGANCNNHYPVLERIPAVAGQDHRPWCSVTGCKYKTRDRCIVCKLPFCNSSSRQCFRVHLIEQDRKDLSKEEIITSVHAPLFNSDILPHTSS